MGWDIQPTAQRKLKSLTNLKNSLEKGRKAEIQVPQKSKVKTHSAILQFCRIKTQTKQRKKKKKKRDRRKLGLGPGLTVGGEREWERWRELREKKQSINEKKKGKNFKNLRFFICFLFFIFYYFICSRVILCNVANPSLLDLTQQFWKTLIYCFLFLWMV